MVSQKPVQLACGMLVIFCHFGSLAFGFPADLPVSIGFHSTCIVPVNHSVTGMNPSAEISLLVNMTILNSGKPYHLRGGCLTVLLDSQIGSHPHRLICVPFGQVVSSNSCISYSTPPMKDLCRNVVQRLEFHQTEDGFAWLSVILWNMEYIFGMKMRLSFKSPPLSNDPACDFTLTGKNYTPPGEPPTMITPSKNKSTTPTEPTTETIKPAIAKEKTSVPVILIVVYVVGAIICICLLVAIGNSCYRRRRSRRGSDSEQIQMKRPPAQ